MLPIDLSARTALITGGAGGIGRACATLFAQAGARVVIADDQAMIRLGALTHRVPRRNVSQPGAAKLAVRPNAIVLEPADKAPFGGVVTHSAYLGDHVEYEVETDVGTLFIIDHAVDRILPAASDATLGFKSRGIALTNN